MRIAGLEFDLAGLAVAMVHDSGAATGRLARLRRQCDVQAVGKIGRVFTKQLECDLESTLRFQGQLGCREQSRKRAIMPCTSRVATIS